MTDKSIWREGIEDVAGLLPRRWRHRWPWQPEEKVPNDSFWWGLIAEHNERSADSHLDATLAYACRNLIHIAGAKHSPQDCPDGTCRRLDIDRALKDIENLVRMDVINASGGDLR